MGLENLDAWKLLVIALVGLFVFGPDKLPKAVSDGLALLRQLRRMANDATGQLGRELGTDLQLEDLNPRALVRKHLLSEDDEAALRAPVQQLVQDLRDTATQIDGTAPAGASGASSATPAVAAKPASAVDWDAT